MNNSIDIKPMDMAIDKTKYEKLVYRIIINCYKLHWF